jgi:type II secretory pathway component GspD/PulD (secretin)
MSRVKVILLMFLICAGILVPAFIEHRAQRALLAENEALRHQAEQGLRLSVENRRLSDSLADSKRLSAEVKSQLQELLKLRAEVKGFPPPRGKSNLVAQVRTNDPAGELASLRAEVARLRQENQELTAARDQMRQLQAAEGAAAQSTDAATNQPAQPEEQQLSLRLIRTQGASFAEKLKRSVGARDDETFEDVFARFLQVNGIPASSVAAAAYDERTGRVILRGAPAALDQIETLTTALDRAP